MLKGMNVPPLLSILRWWPGSVSPSISWRKIFSVRLLETLHGLLLGVRWVCKKLAATIGGIQEAMPLFGVECY